MPALPDEISPLHALADGGVVITVNNRLARALSAAHARAMIAGGALAWETPRVLPFEAFVAAEWALVRECGAAALPRLLEPVEVRTLWLEALSGDSTLSLLAPGAAAASAAGARELLLRHEVALDPARWREHADARAFAQWHRRFEQRLEEGGWIDPAGAATGLAAQVRAGHARLPAQIRLAGFDEPSPQQHALLAAYRARGVPVVAQASPPPGTQARQAGFDTPELELEAAARWARALLDAGEAGPIGVVVPDLERRLDTVEAVFEDLLHGGAQVAPSPGAGARVFNLSLGRELALVPVVADALAALQSALGSVDAATAGRTLLSPYLRGASRERAARLGLDARLRDEGVREIRPRRLAGLAARAGAAQFARQLETAIALAPHPRARPALHAQARAFVDILAALGWPAGRALDSAEYQAAEALRARLQALGGAGVVAGPTSASRALDLLRHVLAESTFQPRAAPAPVQVLGVLEAAGMRFARLWVLGMHDGAWPPAQSPHPLLPVALQREHAMPGASARHTLERARRLTARLLAAAPAPIFSHARADGDERLRPSPLLADVAPIAAAELPRAPHAAPDEAIAAAAPELERLQDWRARSVGHGWRARGGSRVLTDQAACPIRAFVRHRLGSAGIARAPAPLDTRSRGNLAHRLMQSLFQRLTGSAAIAALDDAARGELVAQAAAGAVASVVRRHPGEVPRRLADAERDRLQAMASRWLELEAARAPFQVESVEQRRVVRVGGLTLDVQLDRVDRVDGRRMLLDYKTGRAGRSAWFGERPDEPQLPLYALALDADGGVAAPVAAVAFARLRRGDEGFEGVAEDADWAPGLSRLGAGSGAQKEFPDMSALKAHWARVLGDLAQAFADGDAAVDPKREACRYCEQRPLCRVDAVLGARATDPS